METMDAQSVPVPVRNHYSSLAFYQELRPVYTRIWEILGRPWHNLAVEAIWSKETIPGPEHGLLNPNFAVTTEQMRLLMPLLRQTRFFEGIRLRRGAYNDLLKTGAKFEAMLDRAQMVRDRLAVTDYHKKVTVKRMIDLLGMRPRTTAAPNGKKVDGTPQEIYDQLCNGAKQHPWIREQWSLRSRNNTDYPLWEGPFSTEWHLGIVAEIHAANGRIDVESYEKCENDKPLDDVPARTHSSVTLRLEDGTHILALNAPAVKRPHGPARPTSISTTEYWQTGYGPRADGTLVVATVRIHGLRILGDIERQVHSLFPGVSVWGLSASVSGDPMEYFPHALSEMVWQLQNAHKEHVAELML